MSILPSSAFQHPTEADSFSTSLRCHSRGLSSFRLHTALNALASDGISYVEIAGPSGGKGHNIGAETAVSPSLRELMDRHILAQRAATDAVRAWDELRAAGEVTNVAYANGLLGVASDEQARWLAIVNYRPRSDRESRMKLTYMAAYLIATRGTLNANEMDSVLETPCDRPSTSIS
ncbi:hypothetical protein [Sinorhizobium arboris]|uniref:hypothetical protein n=1 Tax=Sinorhizobium arboris TaxID=76745 RepID=UPI003B00F449